MIDRFLLSFVNARTFLAKLWVLSRPYWFADESSTIGWRGYSVTMKESWIARGLLALIVLLTLSIVYVSKLINSWNARFFNALQDKNAEAFWSELTTWVVLVALFIIAVVYRFWLQQMLTIRWRRWLSEVYFRDWLADRTYYRMELVSQGTDNPEQRIELDIANFTERTVSISLGLLLQIMTLATFATVLWNAVGRLCPADLRRPRHSRLHDVGGAALRSGRLARHLLHRPPAGADQLPARALQRRLSLPHGAHPRERREHRALSRRAGRGAAPALVLLAHLRHLVGSDDLHQAVDLAHLVLRPGRRHLSPTSSPRRSTSPGRSSWAC